MMGHAAGNGREWAPSAIRIVLCLTIIVPGLGLRHYGFGLGLPALIVKYGGSMLWAAMVFFIVALAMPTRSRFKIAALAMVVAIAVELFRLFHMPWLDAFRLTLAGALLLGRIFSPWDIVAYGAGILLGAWLDAITRLPPLEGEGRLI
jgi:Protein of unknown function (DUF2809)